MLLFTCICVQLSVERLSSMKKYVFGFGSAQVFFTLDNVSVAFYGMCKSNLNPCRRFKCTVIFSV